MPRITPWKTVLLVAGFYLLLVALWVALPFPQVSWSKIPSERLWWGGKVVRVYDADAFPAFRAVGVPVGSGRSVGREAFALEFAYDRFSDQLTVGGGYEADYGGNKAAFTHKFGLSNLIDVDDESLPFTSREFVVRVKTGDHDGLNLPWFKRADAALLYWEVTRDEWVDVPLALRVVKQQTRNAATGVVVSERSVQLVLGENEPGTTPSSSTQSSEDGDDNDDHDHDHDYDQYRHRNEGHNYPQALLSIALNPSPQIRAQARSVPRWSWTSRQQIEKAFYVWYGHDHDTAIGSSSSSSSSPSLTFPLRRAICRVLMSSYTFTDTYVFAYVRNPFILFLEIVYVVFWVGVIYFLVVLACWSKRGRPNFWPWTRRFALTRHVVRYVRPARDGGEHDDEDEQEDEDADAESETRRMRRAKPKALTSPWAFFTSSSPLDDLLVTYKVTRPFVQPIHLTLRRRRTQDVEAGEVVAAASTTSSVEVKPVDPKEAYGGGEDGYENGYTDDTKVVVGEK
ncbi:hypothetical protein PV08_01932 [Exophiala spinifera]|uniref:Uncharacterized protein n=1 Tax=Exophiala spinifera TaxID=91928 RepID=A0A0D2A992_9EURO|nr:uncharacterized protein PV08_01932 [Exophiala spinifera]KIW21352.1 hypothetical protein PV08_01932 [Exophiala spinifera]